MRLVRKRRALAAPIAIAAVSQAREAPTRTKGYFPAMAERGFDHADIFDSALHPPDAIQVVREWRHEPTVEDSIGISGDV